MVIFPLAPDQTIAQMWSNGARGLLGLISMSLVCHDVVVSTELHDISLIKRVVGVDLPDVINCLFQNVMPELFHARYLQAYNAVEPHPSIHVFAAARLEAVLYLLPPIKVMESSRVGW